MKFIISLILIALISFAACTIFPWWTIAPSAFIVTLFIPQRPFVAFLAGFFALFILWGAYSMYISMANEHILAHKISQLIFKADNPNYLILVTALIGGLVAGLAAMAAGLLRKPLNRTNPEI